MPSHANKMQKIGYVGDTWLKKVADALNHLYDIQDPVFVPETSAQEQIDEALADCDLVVGTWREDAGYDLICPRFNIDGLCSIEMSGAGGNRLFLGADPVLARLDTEKDMRVILAALRGEIEFDCVARFEASLHALKLQEKTAVPISDFILSTYQSEPVVTGCKKPAPVVTLEMAKRIAAKLLWDTAAFDNVDHLLRGTLAIKASRRCTMPYDAEKLGLTYEADPFWYPAFGWLFKDMVADVRKAAK